MQTTATFPNESTVRVTFVRNHPDAEKLQRGMFACDFAVTPEERAQVARERGSIVDHVLEREIAKLGARREPPGPTLNRPIPVSTRAVPHEPVKASTGDRSPVGGKPTVQASPAPQKAPAPRAIPRTTTAKPAGHDLPRLSREERAVACQMAMTDKQFVEHRDAMAQRDRADREAERVQRNPVTAFDHAAKSFGCTVAELVEHERKMKARDQAELDEITRRKATRGALDGSTARVYTPEPDEFDRRNGAK